jgi:4-hydroxybenzoate polyprenyltransferase
VVVALGATAHVDAFTVVWHVLVGTLAICIIASSNYVLNELQDAPFDAHHPTKRHRPVPSGEVNIRVAYLQWVVLAAVGLGLAALVSWPLVASLAGLWLMGCLYNLPPVRTKDRVYLDVVSEAVNNALRMLAGWYMVTSTGAPPLSLLLSYWMIGCYFMAIKRFAEYRDIRDGHGREILYRKSFAHYSEESLLVSIMFYASTALLFFGAFCERYRLELVVSFPLVALVMSMYLRLGLRPNSPAERPEQLYRERPLMAAVTACAILMTTLLFVSLPFLHSLFPKSAEFGEVTWSHVLS